MKDNFLLNKTITWKQHSTNDRYFYCYEDDKLILLRMNNFPEEILYTIIDGLNIYDIEDKPESWHLQESNFLRKI